MLGQNPSPLAPQILAELQTQNLVNYHTVVPDELFRSYLKSVYGITSIEGLIAKTGSISLASKELKNIIGIEYATNITNLIINTNQITSCPDLSAITSLTHIYIYLNSSLTSIGNISTLVNLNYINAFACPLTDVGNLKNLVNLETVGLYSTQLSNVGDISALTKLKSFNVSSGLFEQSEIEGMIDDLYGNRVALGALSCAINLSSNPGSADAAASRASQISSLISAGCTVTI